MLRATAPAAASASASSLLPRHSRSTGRSSRWPRLLLCCGVLYVCGLLTFILYTRPSSSANEELSADQGTVASQVPSNRQSDAVAIAKAEEHARNVKMLPQNQQKPRSLHCVGWRATDDCSPHGPRLPHLDKPCHMMVQHTRSGYCEVEDRDTKERFRVMRRYCRSVRPEAQFRCFDAEDFVNFPLKAKEAVSKALLPGFTLPRVQGDGKGTKGIVMVVYPKMVPSAYASIRALREVLRCELPIELWYRPKEMLGAPGSMAPLQQLAAMADGRISFQEIDDKKATGFSAKHDANGEVLFLHRNTRKLVGEPKRQNVNLKTAAALRVKKKLLLTQPGRRTKPTLKEIEEELRNGVVTPLPTLDPPEADGYPDAAYWTHLLSFRNTSRRIYYKIDVHPTLDGFTKGQTCYGVTDMLEQNEHFYFQAFANFSFGGLEDQLRRFAMEAAQVVRLHQNDTVRH
ncbi:hypothetical protein PRIC2_004558 [Phytophthora ramorum]